MASSNTAGPAANLVTFVNRLQADLYDLGPLAGGMNALERLMTLVIQDAAPLASAERAIRSLKAKFQNWNEVRVARNFEIFQVLQAGRSIQARERAVLIQEYLRRVFGLQNHLELDWLYDATSERRERLLTSLSMAPAHAAAVLDLDALEEGELAPIGRELKLLFARLGLVKSNPREADVRALLDAVVPADNPYPNFVRLRLLAYHGCDPKNPQSKAAGLLSEMWKKRGQPAAFAAAALELGIPHTAPAAKKSAKAKVVKKKAPAKATKKKAAKKKAGTKAPARKKTTSKKIARKKTTRKKAGAS